MVPTHGGNNIQQSWYRKQIAEVLDDCIIKLRLNKECVHLAVSTTGSIKCR